MRVRTFIYKEWDEVGEMGLMPLSHVGDPFSGAGVAHDIVEHFASPHGTCMDELLALGAIYHTRYEQDCRTAQQRRDGRFMSSSDYAYHTSNDIVEVFKSKQTSIDARERNEFKYPPRTRRLTRREDVFDETAAKGVINYQNEYAHGGDDFKMILEDVNYSQQDLITLMAGWLRYGYRQAILRWYNKPVSSLFAAIEKDADQLIGAFKDMGVNEGIKVSFGFNCEKRILMRKVLGSHHELGGEFDHVRSF